MRTLIERDPPPKRRALICGVAGQDGAYLARLLLDKGYEVFGSSRDATAANLSGLEAPGIRPQVRVVSMARNDFRSVLQTITRYAPDEVCNLAGQSPVGLRFEQPAEAIESISLGTLNLLEVTIRPRKKMEARIELPRLHGRQTYTLRRANPDQSRQARLGCAI